MKVKLLKQVHKRFQMVFTEDRIIIHDKKTKVITSTFYRSDFVWKYEAKVIIKQIVTGTIGYEKYRKLAKQSNYAKGLRYLLKFT